MIKKINAKEIPYNRKIQELCIAKYPGHPAGCPNYGQKEGCPPCPLINEILDSNKPVYVIWTDFKIGEHAKRMWKKHPEWTTRQAYCLLYWQPQARKIHREEIKKYQKKYGFEKIISSPEAHGVSIIGLLAKCDVKLQWLRKKSNGSYELPKVTRKVSLAQ